MTAPPIRPMITRPVVLWPLLWCTATGGAVLLAVSYSMAATRGVDQGHYAVFWAGMLVFTVPVVAVAGSRRVSDRLKLGWLAGYALFTYVPKLLRNPSGPLYHDEVAHWRQTVDIANTGHLFQPNATIEIISRFPGLHVVVATISRSTGLSVWQSALVVLVLAHVLTVFGAAVLGEALFGSVRAGVVVALVYSLNSSFLYFDTQFAYESLAVPLFVWCLAAVAKAQGAADRGERLAWTVTATMIGALTVTVHHLTAVILVLVLLLTTVITALTARRGRVPWPMFRTTAAVLIITGGTTASWIFAVAPETVSYLSPYLGGGLSQLLHLFSGSGGGRTLFAASTEPGYERVTAFVAPAIIGMLALVAVVPLLRRVPREQWSPLRAAFASFGEQSPPTRAALSPSGEQTPTTGARLAPTSEQPPPTTATPASIGEQSPPTRALAPTGEQPPPTRAALTSIGDQSPPTSALASIGEHSPLTRAALSPTSEQPPPTTATPSPTSEPTPPTSAALSPSREQPSPTRAALAPTSEQPPPTRTALSLFGERWLPMRAALSLFGFVYFPSVFFILSPSGAEGARRSWAFSYLGLAVLVAPAVLVIWDRVRWHRLWQTITTYVTAIAVWATMLVGNVAAGLDESYRFPGPFLFGSDTRSLTPEVLATATWFDQHVGSGVRIMTDRYTGLAFVLAADSWTASPSAGFPAYDLFFSAAPPSPDLVAELASSDYEYLIVDKRVATDLPSLGSYFEGDQAITAELTQPIPAANINRYAKAPWTTKVFESDNYVIYRFDFAAIHDRVTP